MTTKKHFLKATARNLRNNMTEAETRLWHEIRRDRTGVRFYRQRILCGFIVDFYAPSARLVVEVDGGQHFEQKGLERDQVRDERLAANGHLVMRFANDTVLRRTDDVLQEIWKQVSKRCPGARPKF